MENGDSAHSEHTHRNCNNAGHDFVYGTRSLCTLREEPEEKFPSALFFLVENVSIKCQRVRVTKERHGHFYFNTKCFMG